MADDLTVTWLAFGAECSALAARWRDRSLVGVFGIPTGGSLVALEVGRLLGVPILDGDDPALAGGAVLFLDDLVDSGTTMRRVVADPLAPHDALYRKPHSPPEWAPDAVEVAGWLRFPWENDHGDPTDAVVRLLEFIGEDPTRDGLKGTPGRVCRALAEMTAGYATDPADVLATTFDLDCDEMVVVTGIPFTSLCEHHVLPFTGTVSIAYIPSGGKVVGLSKLARLVECYARRLQVQERMTTQLADALVDNLHPQGAGVIVRAEHSCMVCRGVGKAATMVTSALRGIIHHAPQARGEFMALAGTR